MPQGRWLLQDDAGCAGGGGEFKSPSETLQIGVLPGQTVSWPCTSPPFGAAGAQRRISGRSPRSDLSAWKVSDQQRAVFAPIDAGVGERGRAGRSAPVVLRCSRPLYVNIRWSWLRLLWHSSPVPEWAPQRIA